MIGFGISFVLWILFKEQFSVLDFYSQLILLRIASLTAFKTMTTASGSSSMINISNFVITSSISSFFAKR